MQRPKPIVWFSRFYLSGLALKTLVAAVNWDVARPGAIQIGLTVALLLWFGIVHRHSNVARWIVLVAYMAGTLWTVLNLAEYHYPALVIVLTVASLVFFSAAVAQLVATAANAWFDKRPD